DTGVDTDVSAHGASEIQGCRSAGGDTAAAEISGCVDSDTSIQRASAEACVNAHRGRSAAQIDVDARPECSGTGPQCGRRVCIAFAARAEVDARIELRRGGADIIQAGYGRS